MGLTRCTKMDSCKFVAYKDFGNRLCTSFKSCTGTQSASHHTTWGKQVANDLSATSSTPTPPTTPATPSPTGSVSAQFVNPIAETRCTRANWGGSRWGDLGRGITQEECLTRCTNMDSCKFV